MTLARRVIVLVVGFGLASQIALAGTLKLQIEDGRVNLSAKDVTIREILEEWARLGQTRIVNADLVANTPVTLELVDTPERNALDILLRSAGGYLAAPRPQPIPNASVYDRVVVMARSSPAQGAGQSSAPMLQAPPQFPSPAQPAVPEPFPDPNEPQDPMEPFDQQPTGDQQMTPGFPQPGSGARPMMPPRTPSAPGEQPTEPFPAAETPEQPAIETPRNPWEIPPSASPMPGVVVQPPQGTTQPGRTP